MTFRLRRGYDGQAGARFPVRKFQNAPGGRVPPFNRIAQHEIYLACRGAAKREPVTCVSLEELDHHEQGHFPSVIVRAEKFRFGD